MIRDMETMNIIGSMLNDKDIPVRQKYAVLEDHFRLLIIDELEKFAENREKDKYIKEYISGIRDAQSSISRTYS